MNSHRSVPGKFEELYKKSVFEGERRFNPDKLVKKYHEMEKGSNRLQRLKEKFAYDPDQQLPSITQSVYFGEPEEEQKLKARLELNSEMKLKKKKKKIRKAQMPDISPQKKIIEHFKLRYDRTTPYEMGTRGYISNSEKKLKKKGGKGWVDYDHEKVVKKLYNVGVELARAAQSGQKLPIEDDRYYSKKSKINILDTTGTNPGGEVIQETLEEDEYDLEEESDQKMREVLNGKGDNDFKNLGKFNLSKEINKLSSEPVEFFVGNDTNTKRNKSGSGSSSSRNSGGSSSSSSGSNSSGGSSNSSSSDEEEE